MIAPRLFNTDRGHWARLAGRKSAQDNPTRNNAWYYVIHDYSLKKADHKQLELQMCNNPANI